MDTEICAWKKRDTQAKWSQRVAECRQSGPSVRQWCDEQGINPKTYYHWQRKLFLFCGRRQDRIKGLYWEGDGFLLLYKRLENGAFQWPRSKDEGRQLTPQQYRWLDGGAKHPSAEGTQANQSAYSNLRQKRGKSGEIL